MTNGTFVTSLLIRKGTVDDALVRGQVKTADGSRRLADTIFRPKAAQDLALVVSEARRSAQAH